MHRHTALPTLLALALAVLPTAVSAVTPGEIATPFDRAAAGAEAALRAGEPQLADSRLRSALLEGWLLLGMLETAEGDLEAARDDFERARTSAVETRRAVTSLALTQLQLGDAAAAVALLRDLAGRLPDDPALRRLLAQALVAAGQPEQAMQELEERVGADPGDLESLFALATGYLRLERPEDADRLMERLAAARPAAVTHLLIGRTYRDFQLYERARRHLEKALALDPEVRRGEYYLGTVDLLEAGSDELPVAIERFRRELALAPDDPVVHLFLGMALVESRRFEEAIPSLEIAAGEAQTRRDGLHFLGTSLVGVGRTAEAIETLEAAVRAFDEATVSPDQAQSIHYQLALALRKSGKPAAAAEHFAAAERWTARHTATSRDRLTAYLDEGLATESAADALTPSLDVGPLAALDAAGRAALRDRLTSGLARAHFNLGVLRAQAGEPGRAARFLAVAADLDPDFPNIQHALGTTLFEAGRRAEAVEPLAAALAAARQSLNSGPDRLLTRMLALARFDAGDWPGAAELLADDPQRLEDPSLAYTLATALVRSGRPDEAEPVFAALLAHRGGDDPRLHVLLGQANAAQGDFPAAVAALERALELDPKVADAGTSLGEIHLRQGDLEAAEAALRGELAHHPRSPRAHHLLATVLDLRGNEQEAAELLRALLADRPEHSDARYLLGKILLAGGDAEGAAAQLEAAAGLAPGEPEVHFQLAQAYRRLGRGEAAAEQLALYQELKRQRREGDG